MHQALLDRQCTVLLYLCALYSITEAPELSKPVTAYMSMQVLLNEIRAYIRLVHLWSQHVPKLRYWGTTCNGSVLVLATELLSGASLAQRGLMNSQEAAQDALAALSAVHAAGVLHGDIRPENVMLLSDDARPSVRLIDFGFAQDAQADRMGRESKQFKQLLNKHTKPASVK